MPTLTRDQVIECYRSMLGREPESEAVVDAALEDYPSLAALYKAFVLSEEFDKNSGGVDPRLMTTLDRTFWAKPTRVDHDVSDEVMARLVDRIRAQWTELGENEPHWSVLTNDNFRSENLTEEQLAVFNNSGRREAGMVTHFEALTGRKATRGVCLELGCGVGRITRYLAEEFDRVVAVDISPGNLRLCQAYLESENVTNVDTVQVMGIEDFETLPPIDFFFSIIVLQHNSPPIQKRVLRNILSKIRPGGGALFQIPTDVPGYNFEVDAYLDSPSPTMEVHCLPKPIVFEELRRAGLEIVDLKPDAATGLFGSHTFYAVKPA
jgi:SAM-dependent methyltransferase